MMATFPPMMASQTTGKKKEKENKKMEYTIKDGTKAGAIEIYFSGKPDEETRNQLKAMRFYWNGKKLCWYGFHTAESVKAILENSGKTEKELTEEDFNNEFSVTASAGYLGAVETTGSKSGFLYGSELTKAIRKDFKRWGVKGVTVSVETYAGGQSIYVTITPNDGDFKSFDEYKKGFLYDNGSRDYCKLERAFRHNWIYYYTEDGGKQGDCIYWDKFDALEETEKNKIFDGALEYLYNVDTSGNLHEENNDALTPQFLARFNKVRKIVDSYNHDNSNSMVDYFDRNFYEFYKLKTA